MTETKKRLILDRGQPGGRQHHHGRGAARPPPQLPAPIDQQPRSARSDQGVARDRAHRHLPGGAPDRPRRHGRGLPRLGRPPGAPGRHQAHPADAGLSAEQRERFRREAAAAARLSHSGRRADLRPVAEDAEATPSSWSTSRAAPWRSWLAAGPLGRRSALRLAREIAEGLAAAHEAGLIHRDLKAENVIVTPAGHAKILDFGLARPAVRSRTGSPSPRRASCSAPIHAMSPEQARRRGLDERSDLFSLGRPPLRDAHRPRSLPRHGLLSRPCGGWCRSRRPTRGRCGRTFRPRSSRCSTGCWPRTAATGRPAPAR